VINARHTINHRVRATFYLTRANRNPIEFRKQITTCASHSTIEFRKQITTCASHSTIEFRKQITTCASHSTLEFHKQITTCASHSTFGIMYFYYYFRNRYFWLCLFKERNGIICIISINARRRTNMLRYLSLYNFLNVYWIKKTAENASYYVIFKKKTAKLR